MVILARALNDPALPLFKQILHYAYNPFFVYYISDCPIKGQGMNRINEETFAILDALAARKVTGNAAKQLLYNHAASLLPNPAMLLRRIIKRDLRVGINVKTINAVAPGLIPTHDVMLANEIIWSKVIFPCYSSVKLDGVRSFQESKKHVSRSGKVFVGLQHLNPYLPPFKTDSELTVGSWEFNKGSGNIRSLNDSPLAVMNLIELPNSRRPFPQRLEIMANIAKRSEGHIVAIPHVIVHNFEEAKAHYLKCRAMGFEGTVLKPLDYQYVEKRSDLWMKMKPSKTEDLPVVGRFEGTGKYRSMLGGYMVKRMFKDKPVIVRVGGGYSDKERYDLWIEDLDVRRGMLMEVKCQEITPDGSMRHPRFIRWRYDK